MNFTFLKVLKQDVLNFIKNATRQDCDLVMDSMLYRQGFYDYILSLRNITQPDKEQLPITFLEQFPDQASKLPAICFVLGNIQEPLEIQTYSYETNELTDDEYLANVHLASAITGQRERYINTKSYIQNSQVIIGCYANNKIEVSWLLTLVDFLVKFETEYFAMLGFIDVATSQTDLRLQQELFPLQVPTRILTVNFKYEKVIPRVERGKAPFGQLDVTLSAEQ